MEFSESNSKRIKRCLSQIIPKEESVLEFVTAKLSICDYQESEFVPLDTEGILCVVINRIKSCLYLQLFDIIEFKKRFEIELYTNIGDGYIAESKLFHIIEFPHFLLGMQFAKMDNNKAQENKEEGGALMQKAIISTSKFLDINFEHYLYNYNIDLDREQKQLEKVRESMKNEQNSKNNENSELKKREAEIIKKIETLKENKEIFDSIEVVDASDKKIHKLIEFHILKVKMKLVKKVYENNFNKYIGTKNIFLLNIKSHKANTHFFDNDDDDTTEDVGRGKFVEFNPNDFIDILNDDDGDDKRRQSLMNIRNKLIKPEDNKGVLKVTPLGGKEKSNKKK